MGLLRKALFGAANYGAYRYVKPLLSAPRRRTYNGLSAVLSTREEADLAIEHLVQEYRVDRSFIYVEPVGDQNSAGTAVSGGDHASGRSSSHDRSDGSLHSEIEVTVPLGQDNQAILTQALREIGAKRVEAFLGRHLRSTAGCEIHTHLSSWHLCLMTSVPDGASQPAGIVRELLHHHRAEWKPAYRP